MTDHTISRTLRLAGAAALAGLASASLLGLTASPAHAVTDAVTVTKVNGVVTITTPNVPNQPGTDHASFVAIDDYATDRVTPPVVRIRRITGVTLTAQSGCTQVSASEARCGATSTVSKVVAYGSEAAEWLWAKGTSEPFEAWGRGGDDRLFGSMGPDVLDGGPGYDELYDDGAKSKDIFRGGGDVDRVSYEQLTAPVVADIDGVADDGQVGENDMISADVEALRGTAYSDTLKGTSVAGLENTVNWITGGNGDDRIEGFGGADILVGDGAYEDVGNDSILGGDGNDTLDGGLGSDWLWGESGTDSADGGHLDGMPDNGNDFCSAEVEVNCEA